MRKAIFGTKTAGDVFKDDELRQAHGLIEEQTIN